MQSCKEIENITAREFHEVVAPTSEPVVLRGLAADWPAVRAANQSDRVFCEYLQAFATPEPVEVMTAPPAVKGAFFYGESLQTRNFGKELATLGAVLERLLTLTAEPSPPALYIQSLPADLALPGFARDNTMPLLPEKARPRVWIGNAVRAQTHYDLSDNIAVVVAGRRRFILFPPDQLPNLYVGPFENTLAGSPVSLADVEDPDLEQFPRLKSALEAGQVAELEPGDAIFIPYGWWHLVRSTASTNMLVNYWWNDNPAHLKTPYGALLLAMFMVRDLPPRYRDVWKNLFGHFVFGENGEPGAHLGARDRGAMATLPPEQHRVAIERVINGILQQIRSSN